MTALQTSFLAPDDDAGTPAVPAADSAAATPAAVIPATYAEMPLDDALDELDVVRGFIAANQPKLNAARATAADLEAVIDARLRERGARVYDGRRLRCRYESRKAGGAGIPLPDALRADLLALNAAARADGNPDLIPLRELDAALPLVTPDPIVKPDLRKTRKLADRGDIVRVVIERHIVEAKKHDFLVIENIEIDVTPQPAALT